MINLPIFLDFEASSLHYDSHPIEVAWSSPDGVIMSYLIKPEPDWVDWDDYAENYIHGISRAQLEAEGLSAVEVVKKMTAALAGHTVYTSDSMFDAKWCEKLFDHNGYSGKLPFKFGDFKVLLQSYFGLQGMPSESLIVRTQEHVRKSIGTRHRAAADVQFLRDVFVSLTSGY